MPLTSLQHNYLRKLEAKLHRLALKACKETRKDKREAIYRRYEKIQELMRVIRTSANS